MKTFLIVAGLLMTGASVYGVVDYNKKSKTTEFNELYKEKPVEKEIVEEAIPLPVVETKKALKTEKSVVTDKKVVMKKLVKNRKDKRVFRMKEFSRGPLK